MNLSISQANGETLFSLQDLFTEFPIGAGNPGSRDPLDRAVLDIITIRGRLYENLEAVAVERAQRLHSQTIEEATLDQLIQLGHDDVSERFWLSMRDREVNKVRKAIGYQPIQSRTRAERGFPPPDEEYHSMLI